MELSVAAQVEWLILDPTAQKDICDVSVPRTM